MLWSLFGPLGAHRYFISPPLSLTHTQTLSLSVYPSSTFAIIENSSGRNVHMHSLLDTTLWSGCVAILGVCGELLGIEFEDLA